MSEENSLEIINVLYELEREGLQDKLELAVVDTVIKEEMREEIYEELKMGVGETVERDTSFEKYNREKREEEKRQRKSVGRSVLSTIKRVVKWAIMMPAIILLGMAIIGVVSGGFIIGVTSLLVGIGIMAGAGFIMSAYSQIMGVLGLFIALGLLSGGGLVLCLIFSVTGWLKDLFKRVR